MKMDHPEALPSDVWDNVVSFDLHHAQDNVSNNVNQLFHLNFFDDSMSLLRDADDFESEILKLLYTPWVDGIRAEYNEGNTKYTAIVGWYEFLKSERKWFTTLWDPLDKRFLETHLSTVSRKETVYFIPDIHITGSFYAQYVSKADHQKVCWDQFWVIEMPELTEQDRAAWWEWAQEVRAMWLWG